MFRKYFSARAGWTQISSSVYSNLKYIGPSTTADGTPLPERFVVDQLLLLDENGQVKQSIVVTRSGDGGGIGEVRSCDATVCISLNTNDDSVSSQASGFLIAPFLWDPSNYVADEEAWKRLVAEQTESPFKNITLEQQQEITLLEDGRAAFAVSISQKFDPWLALPRQVLKA